MIYIRPASISWTHCIQSVSCSFGLWQGSARTSHFCGASLHEISGRFQVVSGCFTRQRAWERSFPTKAPLAQSDPQLQDGLKARMQTWDMTPKKLVPKMVSWCHVLFWEFCPSALQCHIVQPKKVTGPYERSCLPQCLSLTTFARNLRRRVRSPFSVSVSVSRSPKKAKRSVWVVCIVFVKFVTPCHRCIDFYRLAPKPARKKSPVMRANHHLSITEPKSKVVTTWFESFFVESYVPRCDERALVDS